MTYEEYERYRRVKTEGAERYQDFAQQFLLTQGLPIMLFGSRLYQTTVGEGPTRVEIKHDEKYAETGNLWIEVAEKAHPRPGDYVPSGIYRDDNAVMYIIGNYDIIFVFAKAHLQKFAACGIYPIIPNRTKTSRGFLLCAAEAKEIAMAVYAPQADQKIVKGVKDLHALGRQLHLELLADPAQPTLRFDEAIWSGPDRRTGRAERRAYSRDQAPRRIADRRLAI